MRYYEKHPAPARAPRAGALRGQSPRRPKSNIISLSVRIEGGAGGMSPRKMTEPDEHSDACKWWQTLGNCTNGKHHLQAAAKPRASRQKRAPNGRNRSPAQRASGLSRVGQWRGGYRAPRRSPKRASARARAPDLRRGQRNGRKSHNNPKAMMEPKNDDDALLGGMQGYETPRRARRGKRKRKPRTRRRGKGGPTPSRGRRTMR